MLVRLILCLKICSTIFYTRPLFASFVDIKDYDTKKSGHKLTCVSLSLYKTLYKSRKTRCSLIRCAFIELRAHCVSSYCRNRQRVQCSSTILIFYGFSSVSSFGLSFLFNSKRRIDGYPGLGPMASSSGTAEEALVDFPFSYSI